MKNNPKNTAYTQGKWFKKISKNSKTLIIAFTSGRNSYEMRSFAFEYEKTLTMANLPADILLMKDNNNNFYLQNILGVGDDIIDTITFLKKETQPYLRVICIGFSMGGYASILYASLLNSFASISLLPPTRLSHPDLKDIVKGISPQNYQKYKDLNAFINLDTKYFINSIPGNEGCHGMSEFNHIGHHHNVKFFNLGDENITRKALCKKKSIELLKELIE